MKPIFKYSGGKTRELKRINKIISGIEFDRVVEPFAGGAAFAFDQEKPALVSDIRSNNIDVYKAVQDETEFKTLLNKVEETKKVTDRKELEKIFYHWRDEKYQNCDTLWEKAFRWIIIRQLCFSGMDRVNKKAGKFNVPYGWYPKFSTRLNIEHHNLLKDWEIKECSFEESILGATEDDFIFLDPPYLERNSDYGSDTHSFKLHEDLLELLKDTKSNWLLIHHNHSFYENNYKKFNILTDDFVYASQWKGRKQTDRKVKHLYITNFDINKDENKIYTISERCRKLYRKFINCFDLDSSKTPLPSPM